jgi:hypothetical protein
MRNLFIVMVDKELDFQFSDEIYFAVCDLGLMKSISDVAVG